MNLVEVSVPKSARPMCRGVSALALQLNRREQKVPARFIASNLGSYKGKTLVCIAEVGKARNADGVMIDVVTLKPTKKKQATHDTPFWDGSQIVIPAMQN